MKTRSDIQGLRALAVALVVLSHANLLHLTGGYIGVDVFFVISGYLITSIILREYAANAAISNGLGWFSLRAFYLRRFKRIVPAAMLVLFATTVTSYLIFNSVRAHGIAMDALWSVFFLANLHFINLATDYFQQGFSTSPLQHFWSLAVEEQFYLIFPTLLLGALSLHGIKIRNYALNWRRRVTILIVSSRSHPLAGPRMPLTSIRRVPTFPRSVVSGNLAWVPCWQYLRNPPGQYCLCVPASWLAESDSLQF